MSKKVKITEYAEKLKIKTFNPADVRPPRDLSPWPENNKGLILEVGCGVGLHPILWAKKPQHQKRLLIACERTQEKFEKFKRRFENHGFSNILPIHEDALHWLCSHNEKTREAFEKIYFLYPNPYPKENQRNKRFLGMPSFTIYLQSLKRGGVIELRTNIKEYLEEARFLAQAVWNLTVVYAGELREEDEKGVTHFERKYLKRGETCYLLLLKKED